QAEDGIRDGHVTGVQTCALPISRAPASAACFPRVGWTTRSTIGSEESPACRIMLYSVLRHATRDGGSEGPGRALTLGPGRCSRRSEERRVGKEWRTGWERVQ